MLEATVFVVGGCPHEPHGLLVRAFLQCHPSGNSKHLLFGAVGPVGLVGALQSRAQCLHRFDLFFSACEIASARHPETAREADQRIRHGILGWNHRQRGSASPVRPFQDIARRHSGLGGEIDEADRTIAAVRRGERLLDHRSGLGILRELQMCIHRKI